ncbi:MAG: hypothetical protein HY360_11780 [Verrucomicrobia bacterium]|nr:hypothetical protein [Verrucomicrobiota bacterium]
MSAQPSGVESLAGARRPRRRSERPFAWAVSCGMSAYGALAGVRFDRLFHEPDAIWEAYTVGQPRARELFGPDVGYAGPNFEQISYGHINCLGCELTFVRDSEPMFTPLYGSLAEGIQALHKPVDWARAGLMPSYLNLWTQLRGKFPGHAIEFWGFRSQGPITTAWALRGHDFFLDLHDDPPLCMEFLRLVTDSIVSFRQFLLRVNGLGAPNGAFVTDDIAAMIRPELWGEVVVPILDRFYWLQTSGERGAHIENLIPDHIPFLDTLRLDHFDPSVSPRITPADLRDHCFVPFEWLLNPMQTRDFSKQQIRDYLMDAAAHEASTLRCHVARDTILDNSIENVHFFITVAKEIAGARLSPATLTSCGK